MRSNVTLYIGSDAKSYVKNMMRKRKKAAIQEQIERINRQSISNQQKKEQIDDFLALTEPATCEIGMHCHVIWQKRYRLSYEEIVADSMATLFPEKILLYDEEGSKKEPRWMEQDVRNLAIVADLDAKEREDLIETLRKRGKKEYLLCHYTCIVIGESNEHISPIEGWNQLIRMDRYGKIKDIFHISNRLL